MYNKENKVKLSEAVKIVKNIEILFYLIKRGSLIVTIRKCIYHGISNNC